MHFFDSKIISRWYFHIPRSPLFSLILFLSDNLLIERMNFASAKNLSSHGGLRARSLARSFVPCEKSRGVVRFRAMNSRTTRGKSRSRYRAHSPRHISPLSPAVLPRVQLIRHRGRLPSSGIFKQFSRSKRQPLVPRDHVTPTLRSRSVSVFFAITPPRDDTPTQLSFRYRIPRDS